MNVDKKVFKKLERTLIKTLEELGAKNVKVAQITDTSVIVTFDYENKHLSALMTL